jgi:hypothetical protein
MSYHGTSNWPPVWVHMRKVPTDKVIGEVGILIDSIWHSELPTRLFLRMNLGEEPYLGALIFGGSGFCWQVHGILQQNLGRPIKEIGDLDLSHLR